MEFHLSGIHHDEHGECWLQVVGKESKRAKMALPPLRFSMQQLWGDEAAS